MKFDKDKSCFVNDDGSKLEMSSSVTAWRDSRYSRWLREGIQKAGKEVIDNSWAWKADVTRGHSNKKPRQWTGV